MKHITNRRDPRKDGLGNTIEGRNVPLPERMPDEWILTEGEEKLYNDSEVTKVIAYESGCIIGEPYPSEKNTSEELKQMGLIGLYRKE